MPPCDADPDENITGEILAPNLKKKCSKRVIIGRGCGILFYFCAFCERCHWLSTDIIILCMVVKPTQIG